MKDALAIDDNKQSDKQEEKAIPVLACPDVKTQVAFYQRLGFEVIQIQTSPNPFAYVKLGTIELMFYGSRKIIPAANSTMCYIRVNEVDALHDAFASSLKEHTGNVPRSGIPRFTTVRDLKDDRRFTLTDPGGNTLFIGSPRKADQPTFLRTLDNKNYAKLFTVLYDIVYSKEDPQMAADNLSRYDIDIALLSDLDKAKYLLVVLDIQQKVGQPPNDTGLSALLKTHEGDDAKWQMIRKKYLSLLG
ncbi:MAG TPA: VOC family protein [Pedobacter sp.]|uniref:bleomycin resistance protein n=1 Tax=Pedobacter sp. TaxID=1411316 RepID=UPI002C31CBC1|nr:VOC family protein [Pedobacter sp.]HMI03132.1 VOC family protein [Pedobacter sp.]